MIAGVLGPEGRQEIAGNCVALLATGDLASPEQCLVTSQHLRLTGPPAWLVPPEPCLAVVGKQRSGGASPPVANKVVGRLPSGLQTALRRGKLSGGVTPTLG
jgi:hypothetical protein